MDDARKTHTACDFIGVNDQDNESMESQKILLSQVLAMSLEKKMSRIHTNQ